MTGKPQTFFSVYIFLILSLYTVTTYLFLNIFFFLVDAPSVVKTTPPGPELTAITGTRLELSCVSTAFPPPTFHWLQRLPHRPDDVIVRSDGPDLVIDAAAYDDQGEWACRAVNSVGEAESRPLRVSVRGAPLISRLTVRSEVAVRAGEDANLEVEVCANPRPRQVWHVGPVLGGGQAEANVVLQSNERHGRFVVDNLLPLAERSASAEGREGRQPAQDCYLAVLRILGAHPADSRPYLLQLENEHGVDSHAVKLLVVDAAVSQEIYIAIIVGSILTILVVTLIIVYMVKADKCCSGHNNNSGGKSGGGGSMKVDGGKASGGQQQDVGSDRTDVESCHSGSTLSGHTVLPPDALYGTVDKLKKKKKSAMAADVVENVFNDSREQLRPDILASLSRSGSPATGSVGGGGGGQEGNVVVTYNELCFPKASNCGSMKRKKERNQYNQNQYNQSQYNQGQYNASQYNPSQYIPSQYSQSQYNPSQYSPNLYNPQGETRTGYINYLNEDPSLGSHAVTNRIYQ